MRRTSSMPLIQTADEIFETLFSSFSIELYGVAPMPPWSSSANAHFSIDR
jgi:hypothetical protein